MKDLLRRAILPIALGLAVAGGLPSSVVARVSGATIRHRRKTATHQRVRRAHEVTAPSAHAAIIGGEIAEEDALPWMAWVIDERGEELGRCSGTVVAPNLVLTAGHCAVDTETGIINEPSGYSVVTGTTDWAVEAHRQVSGVSRVIAYPDFYLSGALEGWGDAALLELSTPTTAPAIPIASAAESELWLPGTPAVIAGWGRTYYEQESPTERLRLAETVVQSSTWCQENAGGFHPLGQLCTINPPSFATGACEGDSGGPLVAEAVRHTCRDRHNQRRLRQLSHHEANRLHANLPDRQLGQRLDQRAQPACSTTTRTRAVHASKRARAATGRDAGDARSRYGSRAPENTRRYRAPSTQVRVR